MPTERPNVLCHHCGHFGPPSEFTHSSLTDEPSYEGCDLCASDDIEETPACITCHVRPVEVAGTDWCRRCDALAVEAFKRETQVRLRREEVAA